MPRRPLDRYDTPPHYVKALTDRIGTIRGSLLEPCVGGGHLLQRLLVAPKTSIVVNDINRRIVDIAGPKTNSESLLRVSHLDMRQRSSWTSLMRRHGLFNWTITNPPFKHEEEILRLALKHSLNVAFLGRLSFLEPTVTRRNFWGKHGNVEVVVLPRYSFRLNDRGKRAMDNQTCCWMIWSVDMPACASAISFSQLTERLRLRRHAPYHSC